MKQKRCKKKIINCRNRGKNKRKKTNTNEEKEKQQIQDYKKIDENGERKNEWESKKN